MGHKSIPSLNAKASIVCILASIIVSTVSFADDSQNRSRVVSIGELRDLCQGLVPPGTYDHYRKLTCSILVDVLAQVGTGRIDEAKWADVVTECIEESASILCGDCHCGYCLTEAIMGCKEISEIIWNKYVPRGESLNVGS